MLFRSDGAASRGSSNNRRATSGQPTSCDAIERGARRHHLRARASHQSRAAYQFECAAISTSLSQSSPYDAKLVGEDGFVYINRLVFALLHPELACCPILASEVELVALMPGLPVVAIKEMLEGVVKNQLAPWICQSTGSYPP